MALPFPCIFVLRFIGLSKYSKVFGMTSYKKMARILIVEDEAVTRMHLVECLASMGYEVAGEASNYRQAIEKAKRLDPELIIMDIVLPNNKNGIAAANEIRQTMDTPIIFLTAYGNKKYLAMAKEAEAFGYLIKPFNDFELKASVELALYKKEMERRLIGMNIELEEKVRDRTRQLEVELLERKTVMEELARNKEHIEIQARQLQKKNNALEALIESYETSKTKTQKEFGNVIQTQIRPLIKQISELNDIALIHPLIKLIEKNLDEIFTPPSFHRSYVFNKLTARQIEIANLVRLGKSIKEVSDILCLSDASIKFHRKNIRKRLGIKDRKVSLYTFLNSIQDDQNVMPNNNPTADRSISDREIR